MGRSSRRLKSRQRHLCLIQWNPIKVGAGEVTGSDLCFRKITVAADRMHELEERRQKKNYVNSKEWSMWQFKQRGVRKQGFGSVFLALSGRSSQSAVGTLWRIQRKYIMVATGLGLEADRPGFNLRSITL